MEPLPKKNEAHGDDRLSNLPDAILHHILSLSGFQIFDVVKLGVLSKRWNRLWITMPYLDIDVARFYYSKDRRLPRDHKIAENLISFISWVLFRQGQSSLVRFRLSPSVIILEVQMLRWLCAVVERNVQEVDITFLPLREFRLPLFIAVNDSLRRLKITLDIDTRSPNENNFVQLPSVVRLNQLRSFELNGVWFSDSDMLQRLFSGCCSLESLRLDDCYIHGIGVLDFSSTHLKELILCFLHGSLVLPNFELKVSCPNLNNFKYSGLVEMNCILENVSSLETAWIDFYDIIGEEHQAGHAVHSILKELHNVTNLNCDLPVVSCLSSVIDELIRCPTSFPKLKFLSVFIATINSETRVMFHLLNHCPNLEVLTLVSDMVHDPVERARDDEYWELQCKGIVNCQLKTIKFVDFSGSVYELDFLRFLFKNAKSLEMIDIKWDSYCNISIEVIDEVLMFPKASSGIVVTFIDPYVR